MFHIYIVFNDEKIVKCIEKIVNFNFGGDDLVVAATRSVFNVSIKSDYSYQRIEFLGDAQLGCLVLIDITINKT